MKPYELSLEISGPTAMWTRPDTGDTPVSYPAPTFAAAKGIFECILWSQWADIVPTKVEICKPVVYHTYYTNYGGPLRESKSLKTGASFQLLATVLINVCYRLYAKIKEDRTNYHLHGRLVKQAIGTTNGIHAYREVFERRLKRGQLFYTPCLGWKEFTPDYVGRFRQETAVCKEINLEIPSMLKTCFPYGKRSAWKPVYYQENQKVEIEKGVLNYAE